MTREEFKQKYFTNNFYWINENNYKRVQQIGIELGCLNPRQESEIINFHKGFTNLGFRTYEKNNGITVFQKEPFLLHNEVATDYQEMLIYHNKLPVIFKSKFLQEWIEFEYPMMNNLINNLCELDYLDMDKFAIWLQEKVYNDAMKEAHSQFSDVVEYHGLR